VTAEHGAYLATICTVCHGENLAGGTVPGEAADAPKAPNLTPAGALASWDEADFTAALRTGVTPDGRALNPEMMRWVYLRNAHDDEVQAIWAYVQSLPASEFGE
jgi:cytochrome c553